MQAEKAKPEITGIYPLTFLQNALLFHSQQESDDEGFLQVQCFLDGEIDHARFQKSWEQTINRHESLRASVHWENIEKSVQVVHKKVSSPIKFLDWTLDFSSAGNGKLESFVKADKLEKLDLSKAPVSRISLIKVSESRHFMLWSCHHILADGWSASVILKDLLTLYKASENDSDADLPEIPNYKSYLNWIGKQDKLEAEVFWKTELKGFCEPTLISNKTDSKSTGGGKVESFEIAVEESLRLRDFAKKQQVTLSTLIQGIWSLILSRFTNKTDLAFGTIASGRSIGLQNAEEMAGMFMGVLPFRAKISRDENLADWLQSLQIHQSKIRNFEYVGLDEILEWNESSRKDVLFDNLMVFENIPVENIKIGRVSVEKFTSGLTSNYPLTIAIKPTQEIEFYLKYDSSRVSESTVKWFAKNLKKVSHSLFEERIDSVGEALDLITPFESEENQNTVTGPEAKVSQEYIAPGNDTELKLTRIWEALLGNEPIGVNDGFFEIGGTSLGAIRLFSEIEKQFDRKLQPAILLQSRTIGELSKVISDEHKEERFSTLVPLRASGSRPPIYCLHAGGGQVFFYNELAKHLGRDQPVYALQRLGLDDVTQAAQDIEAMASHYLQDIRRIQPKGPYALLAYCFSTSIAWEMTKQIQRANEDVSFLAIVDSPPYYTDDRTLDEKFNRITQKLKSFDLSFMKTIWQGRIKHPIREKWRYWIGDEREKTQQRLMKTLNAKADAYEWDTLPVKVSLFRSESMSRLPEQNKAVEGWNELAGKGVDIFKVGGDHDSLFDEPHVQKLASELRQNLAKGNSENEMGTAVK